jgi:hypothetical protein
VWDDPEAPARRVLPALFGPDEPNWGAGALLHDGWLYAWAYEPRDRGEGCGVARVGWGQEASREAWRFWDGQAWTRAWADVSEEMTCAPFVGVVSAPFFGGFVAFYMPPVSEEIVMRTAPAPQGPWSRPIHVGWGAPAADDAWDYALVAHPELARDDGRVQVLSYTRPSGFLAAETRLVEVHLR